MESAPRVWLFPDYNQAESRIVAWKAPVPKLKQWYLEGVDVHASVCQLVARIIQENHIATPINQATSLPLFNSKGWRDYAKGDEEREISKRVVHAYDYGMGAEKLALVTGVPFEFAQILLVIIDKLFPEIKLGYHKWVVDCLKRSRTITMPAPVMFRKVFWDDVSKPEVQRSAYSCYPQCTIGSMLKWTISRVRRIFRDDDEGRYRREWCEWYGEGNWGLWRRMRARSDRTPQAILWSGFDVRLNVHDAGGISVPDVDWLILWVARTWKTMAEHPISIHPHEAIVIPVDFQIGTTWGALDLKPYKLV